MAYGSTSSVWRHTARRRRLLEDLADSEGAASARVSFSRTGILLYASAPGEPESPPFRGWIAAESHSG